MTRSTTKPTTRKNNKANVRKGIHSLLGGSGFAQAQKLADELRRSAEQNSSIQGVMRIPISQIVPNPDQPRRQFSDDTLQELADSIRQHNVLQAVTVSKLSDTQYRLIAGERRYRAARMVGLADIPAHVLADVPEEQILELALIENLQREDLNPIEVAQSFERLITGCSYTHEQLAHQLSKDRATVTNYLRLLKLHPAVQDAVRSRQIQMGHARTIAGLSDSQAQLFACEQVCKKQLSVRKTEQLVKELQQVPLTVHEPPVDATPELRSPEQEFGDLGKMLGEYLGTETRINIQAGKQSGKISFTYSSFTQLRAILQKIGFPHA